MSYHTGWYQGADRPTSVFTSSNDTEGASRGKSFNSSALVSGINNDITLTSEPPSSLADRIIDTLGFDSRSRKTEWHRPYPHLNKPKYYYVDWYKDHLADFGWDDHVRFKIQTRDFLEGYDHMDLVGLRMQNIYTSRLPMFGIHIDEMGGTYTVGEPNPTYVNSLGTNVTFKPTFIVMPKERTLLLEDVTFYNHHLTTDKDIRGQSLNSLTITLLDEHMSPLIVAGIDPVNYYFHMIFKLTCDQCPPTFK